MSPIYKVGEQGGVAVAPPPKNRMGRWRGALLPLTIGLPPNRTCTLSAHPALQFLIPGCALSCWPPCVDGLMTHAAYNQGLSPSLCHHDNPRRFFPLSSFM